MTFVLIREGDLDTKAQRRRQRQSRKAVIFKPGREASEENQPADTLILIKSHLRLPGFRTGRKYISVVV